MNAQPITEQEFHKALLEARAANNLSPTAATPAPEALDAATGSETEGAGRAWERAWERLKQTTTAWARWDVSSQWLFEQGYLARCAESNKSPIEKVSGDTPLR